jgi:RNA polymerase sigma factor for flagellar operon FliA
MMEASAEVDRRALIEDHQGLVRAIAHKVGKKLPRNLEFDDLVAYGMIGLVEASQRFDPNGGARFSSYAYYRIQGAIYDGLRKFGWLNRTEYAHVRAERGASDYLTYEADRHASVLGDDKRTLEEQVKGSADVIANLVTVFVTSLEGIEGFEPSHDGGAQIHNQVEKRQMVGIVREVLDEMKEEDQVIIMGFYFEDKTLKELGEDMGISKSWMSRKHAQAIGRLREMLEKRLNDTTLVIGSR